LLDIWKGTRRDLFTLEKLSNILFHSDMNDTKKGGIRARAAVIEDKSELEFLNNLWGLGTE
jgi:hypothetical protein